MIRSVEQRIIDIFDAVGGYQVVCVALLNVLTTNNKTAPGPNNRFPKFNQEVATDLFVCLNDLPSVATSQDCGCLDLTITRS